MISWVPYDLDQAREAMSVYSTLEQRGLWSCGFMQGATGAILMGGEPDAFLAGYAAGASARENSEEYRKEQVSDKRRAAAEKRWKGRREDASAAPADANEDANEMQEPMQTSCKSDANGHAKPDAKAMQNDAYRTVQDITKQGHKTALCVNAARAEFSPAIRRDASSQPTREEFVAYAAHRWPEWHEAKVSAIYAEWSARCWTTPEGGRIANWTTLLAKFRKLTDPAHLGERVPLGRITSAAAGIADGMRLQP